MGFLAVAEWRPGAANLVWRNGEGRVEAQELCEPIIEKSVVTLRQRQLVSARALIGLWACPHLFMDVWSPFSNVPACPCVKLGKVKGQLLQGSGFDPVMHTPYLQLRHTNVRFTEPLEFMRFRRSVNLGCIFDRPLIVQTGHLVLGLKYMRAYKQLIYMTYQGQKKKGRTNKKA